jgi:hypothetical protein
VSLEKCFDGFQGIDFEQSKTVVEKVAECASKFPIREFDVISSSNSLSGLAHNFPRGFTNRRCEKEFHLPAGSGQRLQLAVDSGAYHPRIIKDEDIGRPQEPR